jgi:hypothetical protein
MAQMIIAGRAFQAASPTGRRPELEARDDRKPVDSGCGKSPIKNPALYVEEPIRNYFLFIFNSLHKGTDSNLPDRDCDPQLPGT